MHETWDVIQAARDGKITTNEFRREILTFFFEEMGWLIAQQHADMPVAGVHCHILDAAGQVYANRQAKLQEYYQLVDESIEYIRSHVDELLILSDHGMQVEWLGDDSPGTHSWRAMVASTIDEPLPTSAFDVRDWIESQTPDHCEGQRDRMQVDAPTEHLKDLGYIS